MGSSASTENRKKLSAAEITESLDALKAKITELADDEGNIRTSDLVALQVSDFLPNLPIEIGETSQADDEAAAASEPDEGAAGEEVIRDALLKVKEACGLEVNWEKSVPLTEWAGVKLSDDESQRVSNLTIAGGGSGAVNLTLLPPLWTDKLRKFIVTDVDVAGDLSVFTACPELRELTASGKALVGDVKSLEACSLLCRVKLRGSGVSGDIGNFANHSRLSVLWCDDTAVRGDIASLSGVLPKCDIACDV